VVARHFTTLALAVLLCGCLAPACAGVLLTVAIDTTSLTYFGDTYTLDFQLNGGIGFYDPISVLISNFQTDSGHTDVPTTTGNVTGTLLSQLAIDNGATFNEYSQPFFAGSFVSFQALFTGPGLNANFLADSGSGFLFTPYTDLSNFDPIDFPPPGPLEIDFNTDGSLVATDLSLFPGSLVYSVVAVPEPAQWAPLGAAIALLWFGRRRRFPRAAAGLVFVLCVGHVPLGAQVPRRGFGQVSNRDFWAGGPIGPLTYRGGPLMRNPAYLAVYWGSYWTSGAGLAQRNTINSFLQTIAPSAGFTSLFAEYAAPPQTILAGSFAGEKVILPGPATASISDDDIQNQIRAWILAGTLPIPDANTVYTLMTPAKVDVTLFYGASSCGGFGGYHDSSSSPAGAFGRYRYIVIPYLNCGTFFSLNGPLAIHNTTMILSHEMAELETDPDPYAIQIGWIADDGEIGDICFATAEGAGYQGFWMQKLWSNAANACVGPANGNPAIHLTISARSPNLDHTVVTGAAMVSPDAPFTFTLSTDSVTPLQLNVSGLPAGITATLSSNTVVAGSNATMRLSSNAAPGPTGLATVTAVRGTDQAQFQFLVSPWRPASGFRLTSTAILFDFSRQMYTTRLTVTNTGTQTIGPTALLVCHNLDRRIDVISPLPPAGAGFRIAAWLGPGGEYAVQFPNGGLAPGQSYTFAVGFLNPEKIPIKFTPLVFTVQ
jgi:hypothetical protein